MAAEEQILTFAPRRGAARRSLAATAAPVAAHHLDALIRKADLQTRSDGPVIFMNHVL